MDTKEQGGRGGTRGRGRGTEREHRHRGAQHGRKNSAGYDGRGHSGKDGSCAADGGVLGNGSKEGRGGNRGGHERGRGGWHGDRGRGKGAHPEHGKVRQEDTEHGPSERNRGRGSRGGGRGRGRGGGRGGPDHGRGRGGRGGLRRAGSRSELSESGNIQELDPDGMRTRHSPAGQSVPIMSSPPAPPPHQTQQFIPPLMEQRGRPPLMSDSSQVGVSSPQPCIRPPSFIPPLLHQGGPQSFSPRPQSFTTCPPQGPIAANYRPGMQQFPPGVPPQFPPGVPPQFPPVVLPQFPPGVPPPVRPTGVASPMRKQGQHDQPSRDHGTRDEFQQRRTRGSRRNESNRKRGRQHRNSSYDRRSNRDESESLYDSDDGDNVSVVSSCSISDPQEVEEHQPAEESDSSNVEEYPDLGEDVIKSLMTKPLTEVCRELTEQKGSVGKLLSRREVPSEELANIVHVLAQIIQDEECDASQLIKTIQHQTRLLKLHLPQYILLIRVDTDETPDKLLQQIQAVMIVLQEILNVANRQQAASAQSLLLVIGDALRDMESKGIDVSATIKDLLQSCDNKRKDIVTGTTMKKKKSEPAIKFPTSDFPDSDEIRHSDRPPLIRETRDRGLYESTTECINAQLQVARERIAAAIRERVSRYHELHASKKDSPDELNRVPVYRNVTLRSVVESNEQRLGLTYRMHFDNSPFQSVNWDTSAQLLQGSVVCLSFDHFKTLVYGIVSKRQAKWLKQGLVELRIPNKEDVVSLLTHDNFYMIDCRVMEDGMLNVLSTLRLLTDVTMPLQNHFISMDSPQKAATFCRGDDSSCSYDLSQLVKEEIQYKRIRAKATSVPLTDVNCWPEITSSCLDEFQMKAMRAALTQEFTAIAGAPGTGKRYLGLKIIEILLQNRHIWGRSIGNTSYSRADVDSGPILVLSADDASLDHFLSGVLKFQGEGIIRFGSKSSHPQINDIDASTVSRKSTGASKLSVVEELRAKLSQLHRNIQQAKGTILEASSLRPVMDERHFENISQNGGMAAWILPQRIQDGQASDVCTSVGSVQGEGREWTECSLAVAYDPKERAKQGKERDSKKILGQIRHPEVMKKETVQCIGDLWSLPQNEKWSIYRFWVALYEQEVAHRVLDICEEVDTIMHEVAKGNRASEYSVFRAASVLGMTASAAVANHDVLRYVQPRITLVDQAQDVTEAVLISTLSPDCRQLIMLGECEPNVEPDVAVRELANRSDVKISFFERVLDKNYAVNSLKIQHRMRPEISKFLKREMYPDLTNDSSVTNFSNVPGVAENVYFLRHGLTGNEASRHEAEFLSELCRYVTLQGHTGDISILVNSVHQQEQVKEILGKSELQHVVVDLLDTFQGECDIALLATCGMQRASGGRLRSEVRMKRALTRARKGLYVISNVEALAKKCASVLMFFDEAKRLTWEGPQLTLTCSTHRDQSTLVSKAEDIRRRIQMQGCGSTCHARLKCGHSCKLPCHKHDNNKMGNYRCEQPCQKKICSAGHKCTKRCAEKCDKKCNKDSLRELGCGHSQLAPCSLPTEMIQCRSACEKMLPCGHQCPNTCGEECATKCLQYVTSDGWPCGHKEQVLCSDSEEMCPHPCAEELKCGHVCQGTCGTCMRGRLHIVCQKPCGRILVCGHQCKSKCSATCPPCSQDCQNKCKHSRCTESCGEECIPCQEHCEWQCPHQSCRQVCYKPCDREPCQQPCTKVLRCGHECIGLCGEPCPKKCRICHEDDVTSTFFGTESEPDARFVELEDCSHVLEVEGLDKWMTPSNTDESENIKLKGCPKCSTPIRKNLRYGNVIKRALTDIEAVKRKMMGSAKELKGKRRQLRKNVEALSKSANGNVDMDAVDRFLNNLNNCNHLETVVSRLNRCNFVKEVIALERQAAIVEGALREESATKRVRESLDDIAQFRLEPLSARLVKMKHRLCDGDLDRFAEQQVDDMMSEIIRTGMEIDLAALLTDLSWWNEHPEFQTRVMDFDALIASGKPLTLEQESEAKSIITAIRKEKGIKEASSLGISERERMQVVHAIGLSQGHWFKCREGHIYAIGECGGAMERSQCPECGGAIGGQRHRLTDENRLAGEMDKAQHAAWSKAGAAAPFGRP